MAHTPRTETVFTPAGEITDELARAAWDCRLRCVQLREDIDPEEDFGKFSRLLRAPGSWLATCSDAAGQVRGTFLVQMTSRRWRGRTIQLALPEYTFLDEEGRGANWLREASLGLLLRFSRQLIRPPVYLAGACYLPSFLASASVLRPVWLLGEAGTPEREGELMWELARERCGDALDEATGLVRMPTMPRASQRRPSREVTRALAARYLAHNPGWQQGYGVFMMTPLDPVSLSRSLVVCTAAWLRRHVA